MSSTPVVTIAALVVGLAVGALFAFLRVPIPAPPELPGVVAIVGIYLGFKLVGYAGVGFDLLDALGCSAVVSAAGASYRDDRYRFPTTVGTVLHPAIGPSRMYDDILLPVAPGGKGNDAIPHAKSLAERYDATVHVVSAIDTVAQTLRGPESARSPSALRTRPKTSRDRDGRA